MRGPAGRVGGAMTWPLFMPGSIGRAPVCAPALYWAVWRATAASFAWAPILAICALRLGIEAGAAANAEGATASAPSAHTAATPARRPRVLEEPNIGCLSCLLEWIEWVGPSD